MTKLSRKVEYALMVLKHMVDRGSESLICAKDVSDALHTPFEVTAKILQTLVGAQILRSEKGLQGGYRLIKQINEISLHQLVEIIDGPSALVKCIHSEQACEIQTNCNISTPLSLLNDKLNNFFQQIYLSDLFDINHSKPLKNESLKSEATAIEVENENSKIINNNIKTQAQDNESTMGVQL